MTGEVIDFPGYTTLDSEPDMVLEKAKGQLNTALVLGWTDDDEIYFAGSTSNSADIVYLLEFAKQFFWELQEDMDYE